jgi:hypothetical protein
MDMDHVPRKTDKGRIEIQTRAFHVGHRERSVLIMVDGKTPARVLLARLAFMSTANEILDDLRVGGFIDDDEPAQPLSLPASAKTAPLNEALRARQFARDFILETLDPGGDDLAMELEACLSREQLIPLLEKCRDHIKVGAGGQKAREFWNGLGTVVAAPDVQSRLAA